MNTNPTFDIRHFRESDFPALGAFYAQAAEGRRIIFWWVGEQENWQNVFCAFEGDVMIAKGQVEIFSVMPANADPATQHRIFFNIKTQPERATDTALLSAMYDTVYARALELQQNLPASHGTLLCFGNFVEETDNTRYFTERPEFSPLKRQYRMRRDLLVGAPSEVSNIELPSGYEWRSFDKLTDQQADEYMALDLEIWAETPIGMERLVELASRDHWRLLQIHTEGQPVASLMYWISEKRTGEIEEVLVREPHRRRGLASALLNYALQEIVEHPCDGAELDVEAINEAALSVYNSAGFRIVTEEHRYATEL